MMGSRTNYQPGSTRRWRTKDDETIDFRGRGDGGRDGMPDWRDYRDRGRDRTPSPWRRRLRRRVHDADGDGIPNWRDPTPYGTMIYRYPGYISGYPAYPTTYYLRQPYCNKNLDCVYLSTNAPDCFRCAYYGSGGSIDCARALCDIRF